MKILITCPPMLGRLDEFMPILNQHPALSITKVDVEQTLSEDELLEILPGHAGWIVGDDPASEQVLSTAAAKGLKAVIKWGIGIDNIDLNAIDNLDIKFTNTPFMFGDEVADVAIGYIIGLARELFFIDRQVRKGMWPKPPGSSLKNKNVGIVGGGDIGSQIAIRSRVLGMNPFIYDPKLVADSDFVHLEWPNKLAIMDYIVFACSLTDSSYHMFNFDTLKLVKKGVRIVNVSRGSVIEQYSLIEGLDTNKVRSAALDVMEIEPLPISSELLKFEECIFGSHNSSNTIEAVDRASKQSIKHLLEFLGFEE